MEDTINQEVVQKTQVITNPEASKETSETNEFPGIDFPDPNSKRQKKRAAKKDAWFELKKKKKESQKVS